jgi:hypothetical protein
MGEHIISIIIMAGPIIIFKELGSIPEGMLYSLDASGKGFTLEIIVIVMIKAIFQNALSEEVFYRGYIGKRQYSTSLILHSTMNIISNL